ncbi:hypothetical protein [Halobacterium sp. R2-5]|uniref:hypothetical protein n=1 Tax=Halobacterium sp. R2-5 TaxID=2715751 RepID=UPI00142438DE|nr:hypothetical protein [Halobacterium sp. R2-5]NIC00956.1 hypothetical protein [Halobacterium sp. R2-5]
MARGHEPSEESERAVTVILLYDEAENERVRHASYEAAVGTVKERAESATVAKIESKDGEIVFRSDEMAIQEWANEWTRAKRRLSVDIDEWKCPYDSAGCIADDLCTQCKLDKIQDSY